MASWIRFAEAARGVRARARLALHGGVAGSLLAICALAAGGFPARAAEGVVEINQRCADSSGPDGGVSREGNYCAGVAVPAPPNCP